ncbi:MAG TPA: Do family serine endopeptidase [Caldimonas sp.]|jgi:serine protease Do|nr:Do family serine endopeptidase [Caldimonas sp.]HEV7575341.1 Do family serine endopeptidase [Caldimonas sp.]
MSLLPLSPRSPANRLAYAALALSFSLLASVAPSPVGAQGLPDFTELVEKVGPAVVNIRTTERGRTARGGSGNDQDDEMAELFRRFFGVPGQPNRPNPRGGPQPPDGEPQQRGVGSGFILNADGYVLTNAHVVEGADEVIVTLADKREFKAKPIGADKRSDVALVKIEASGLPTVRIGDVSKLKVGEWVIAIGSPFGLESTVTAGIVSAKSRDTGDLLPLIQTDVAINPGNSGGPLINMRGEVVGINSQIYSRSGGYMGISFAIPIDEVIRVSEQLRVGGRVIRGRIGVVIARLTREVAESIGLGKPVGALVQSVEAGGPAEKAGVEPGDVITKVDGRAVDTSVELPRIVGGIKPGTKATLQVFRRGSTRDLSVVVAEFEPERVVARKPPERDNAKPPTVSSVGVAVSDLTDAQKRELKVKNGVKVESVEGAAARAGIHENDVILSVDNVEVTGAKQFESVMAKLDKAKPVTMLIRQGESAKFVIVRPAK